MTKHQMSDRTSDRVFIRIHNTLSQEELAERTGLTVLEVARIQKELKERRRNN